MKKPFPAENRAFSMVEVTIALAVVAFGLIAIMGLIPTGVQQVRETSSEATAVNILSDLAAEISTASTRTEKERIKLEPGAKGSAYYDSDGRWIDSATRPANAVYHASWEVRRSNAERGTPANVYLRVSWPAVSEQGSTETIIALDHEI